MIRKLRELVTDKAVRDHQAFEDRRLWHDSLDALAACVFPTQIAEDKILDLYVPSSEKLLERYGWKASGAGPTTRGLSRSIAPTRLGPFERNLLSKLATPPCDVMCVVGAVGCGKSTAIQFLRACIAKHLDRVCEERCPQSQKCPGSPTFALLDFRDRDDLEHVTDPAQAHEILTADFARVFDAAAHKVAALTDKDEFLEFWNEQLNAIAASRLSSAAFCEVEAMLRDTDTEEEPTREIARRRKIRRQLFEDHRLRKEYLALLWNYVLRITYGGHRLCQIVVLDNLDRVPPVVQTEALNIVLSLKEKARSTFLLLMRPETYRRRASSPNEGEPNSEIIDVIPHVGAGPLKLCKTWLERFVADPSVCRPAAELASDEYFESLVSFLRERANDLKGVRDGPLARFIDAACGYDSRNALAFMHGLLAVDPGVHRTAQVPGDYDMIRQLIREGEPYYVRETNTFIENIFSTDTGCPSAHLLLKLRLLRLLDVFPKKRASLGEITREVRNFGYPDDEYCAALSELLNPYRQLIRSNGLDSYDKTGLTLHVQDTMYLSEKGSGYLQYLSRRLEYVEEVMFDARVQVESFPGSYLDESLSDRLNLVYAFALALVREDEESTRCYVRSTSIERHRLLFPSGSLARPIVDRVADSVGKIVLVVIGSKERPLAPLYANAFLKIRDNFRRLVERARALDRGVLYM